MAKLNTYDVRVSRTLIYKGIRARTVGHAKEKVWKKIKSGYAYGYKNKTDFMKRAKVERVK